MSQKITIITGASRGIGQAIAQLFTEKGYYVIGTSTSGVSDNIPNINKSWLVDFNNEESTNIFYKKLKGLKRIDILVNNAGINIIKEQSNVDPSDYAKIEQINLRAPYFISAIVANCMAESGGGRIVNIASIWSVISKEHRTLYSTMKSGLHGLTRSMAVEWAKSNVLINTVSPGFVNTDLTRQSLTKTELESIGKQVPLTRLADPREIAELVYFLTSTQNTYLTGQNIIIDGGFSIV
jgi:3-oxoacyl-[acyl-carrier protein] reductase